MTSLNESVANRSKQVLVVDYDPAWREQFESLRSTIWPAVSDIALSIEHVGSTAVPGLSAKPVIDIDVVVRRDAIPEGITRLETLGYTHRGDLGIPEREAFGHQQTIAHHLYLCPTDSTALANHLGIRNYLRSHPTAAREYGELKHRLAAEFRHDVDGYVEGKTAFLVGVLATLGFGEAELSGIVAANRRPTGA